MILPDTSVWIDHFRDANSDMKALLQAKKVSIHPFVIGELALGTLPSRQRVLANLNDLPLVIVAENSEVLHLIHTRSMHGRGIGLIDAHLLASVMLTPEAKLWTRDKRLRAVARDLSLNADLDAKLA